MKKTTLYLSILLITILTISCSDDSTSVDNNDNGGEETSAQYVIASTPTASEGVADYLLTSESLTEGSVSTVGNGIEQDGTYRYYITNNNKFYSLLYGQGNPGAVTAYELNDEGNLDKLVDFQSESMHAFANVDDEILMMDIPRSGEPNAHWYRLDTNNSQFVEEGQINIEELAGNGERAYFSWLTQVGNQLFAPYASIKGCCNDNFGTQYPDSAWVAVYSYSDMELERVIKDDRTSYIGRYFTKGLSVDENGDIYAFSSAIATNNNEFTSNKPSAVTRINNGATAFDQDYFFNIEEASSGFYLTDHVYASDGNVLLMMSPTDEKASYSVGHHLAIIKVYDQSFSWVQGLPDAEDIISVLGGSTGSIDNYVSEDGSTVYTGITIGTTTENEEGEEEVVVEGSYVYAIDIASAAATRGLEVEGGVITSINKLDPVE